MITCDFRLIVFHTAATELNFTRAAEELHISQPAVSKNIHELERQVGQSLFERQGSRLLLSQAGKKLLEHAQLIIEQYHRANEELSALGGWVSGQLKVGASTTLSHYIVPVILADFHQHYEKVDIKVWHGNSRQVEQWIIDKSIDMGILEGLSDNPSIKYDPFFKDEIVLVTRVGNPQAKSGSLSIDQLQEVDLVLRESGSGTNDVIRKYLHTKGLDMHQLRVHIHLASTESIKQFLLHSDCFAFMSIHAALKELQEGLLTVIDIEQFSLERDFYFAYPQGVLSGLPNTFMQHARQFRKKMLRLP